MTAIRILAVDERRNVEVFTRRLNFEFAVLGLEPAWSLSYEAIEARRMIRSSEPFDVVITELFLTPQSNVMDGLDVTRDARARSASTFIVAMTGNASSAVGFRDAAAEYADVAVEKAELLVQDGRWNFEKLAETISRHFVDGGRPASSVFLCHSSGDKERVRELYERLSSDGVECWFDEADLLGGQDWDYEISRAIQQSKTFLACLSNHSVTKRGYVQTELKKALDVADMQPEGAVFILPVRLEDCIVPDRLSRWHRIDLFLDGGYGRLLKSLRAALQDRSE